MTAMDVRPIKLSVAICTHNPRLSYLQRTLGALEEQTLPMVEWELLIIDNNSDRPVKDMACTAWHPRARWLHEEQLGLTQARLCVLSNTRSDLVIFVDDDNVLRSDYLENAARIHAAYPEVAVFGAGAIEPEFEVPPPAWLRNFRGYLALRTLDAIHVSDSPTGDYRPWGAGLCVGSKLARAYLSAARKEGLVSTLGRKGKILLSGEDDMFSLLALRLGFKFGVCPDLKLKHLIPKERLDFPYMKQLVHGHASSHAMLAMFSGQSTTNPFMIPSWKAALGLMMAGKTRLGWAQFRAFVKLKVQSREVKELWGERCRGWEEGASTYNEQS